MIENVSLVKNKQKSFNKTVKKTKNDIKKGKIKIADKVRIRGPKTKKGIVYVSNIPHGFYEKELKAYFNQFGNVIKTRVARSKKTGNSKGHAFIMFRQEEVAKIAAETMNNYLMGKKLLKAKLLPYNEKAKGIFRKPNFSKEHYPTVVRRLRFKKSFNAPITPEKEDEKTKKIVKHIEKIQNKLKECGIDYEFTLDIPSPIKVNETKVDDTIKQEKKTEKKIKVKKEKLDVVVGEKTKKQKKVKKVQKQTEKVEIEKENKNINDSLINDTTSPEKTARMFKREENEIKNRRKQSKSKNKKIKEKIISENTDNTNEEKKIKKKRNKENKTETNKHVKTMNLAVKENTNEEKEIKKKRNKVNKTETNKNDKTMNLAVKENKIKKKVAMKIQKTNEIEQIASPKINKKRKEKRISIDSNQENIVNSPSPKKNKKKTTEKNKISTTEKNKNSTTQKTKKVMLSDITDSSSPNIIKKKIKKNRDDKTVEKKTLGVIKKSKKTEKISDKKASLIKKLIQENDQVKSVKKIQKNKVTKKKITQN